MSMAINKSALVAFAFGLVCAVSALAAQEQNKAKISGTVTDSSGAAIAGVEISLKNIECVCSQCQHDCDCCPDQSFKTDDAGHFSLSTGHGRYSVTLKKTGFRAVKIEVDLRTANTKNLEVAMTPGDVASQ